MVVVDPILVPGRRSGRLNAPDQPLVGQNPQGVVNGLTGDGAYLGACDLLDVIRRPVGSARHGPHDGQALRRDLDSGLPK